ncbi:hypothetical protein AWW66_31080 [Micromonospora rosaria]|uniref:Glycosyltransferase RgtA/B/C/D-like domain-containing protein n=1 Tax=Micromonospora rosaria TaxID=47874 RepID=A0A136PII3_9ACTN|nr:hypothetical protein AWW66_31080 [Micromonospora rosaria]
MPTVLTLVAALGGVGYRIGLVLADTPPTNSDEATMGLAALHIAQGREFPAFFYGQAYMGTLEAWLAAPVLALTGPSVPGLRLPTLAMYALLVALAWRLTRRLTGDRWFTLLVVALLALGSDRIVKNQVIAGGGYPEMGPAALALALLALGLAAPAGGRRLPRWAAWGLVSGLMIWVDPLLLPYIAATGAVLLRFRWRELRGRAGVVVAVATLVGTGPLLLDAVLTGRNPVAAVLTASGADQPAGWADRLHGGLLLGPALGMGFCSPGRCAPWQVWWSVAFPVLLAVAGYTAWRTVRATTAHRYADGAAGRAGAAVRLALLAGAAGTLAAYTLSSAAGRTPVESSRYLSCLLVAVPALLWPLWTAARAGTAAARRVRPPGAERPAAPEQPAGRDRPAGGEQSAGPGRLVGPRRLVGAVAVAVLAATGGTAVVATVGAVRTVPAARADAARHDALVATLRRLGVRHVWAPYWTCNRLTFATGEEVVCAVIDDDLTPGFDRYPPYRRAVAASTRTAYVVPTRSPTVPVLDRRLAERPDLVRLMVVDGYRIYLNSA